MYRYKRKRVAVCWCILEEENVLSVFNHDGLDAYTWGLKTDLGCFGFFWIWILDEWRMYNLLINLSTRSSSQTSCIQDAFLMRSVCGASDVPLRSKMDCQEVQLWKSKRLLLADFEFPNASCVRVRRGSVGGRCWNRRVTPLSLNNHCNWLRLKYCFFLWLSHHCLNVSFCGGWSRKRRSAKASVRMLQCSAMILELLRFGAFESFLLHCCTWGWDLFRVIFHPRIKSKSYVLC